MSSTPVAAQPGTLKLQVSHPTQSIPSVSLADGASVMIGSGVNCGIRLNQPQISSIHCLLRAEGGRVHLQVWCSALGTKLNGDLIDEEAWLEVGDVLTVGQFTIALADPSSSIGPNKVAARREKEELPALEPVVVPVTVSNAETTPPTVPVIATPSAALTVEPQSPRVDDTQVRTASTSTPSIPSKAPAASQPRPASVIPQPVTTEERRTVSDPWDAPDPLWDEPAATARSWDDETIALLQSEVQALQSELAERDQQLAELRASVGAASVANGPAIDEEQTEALVARLEQLLDELSVSDQRALALEELLRAEQERSSAEAEERAQIDNWLQDIEQRLASREAEWTAEKNVLLRRVTQLKADREQVERHLHRRESTNEAEAALQEVIQGLRQQLEQERERAEAASQSQQKSEQAFEAYRKKTSTETLKETVEEALREERLKLAQERANISRERAELLRQATPATDTTAQRPRSEADVRFLALRETLKEIHEDVAPAPRKASLTSRLADLWRRLDGPTDTD